MGYDYKDSNQRITDILNTAEDIIINDGLENLRIREIVKKMGIAQGTIYYYFKSKEAIIDEIIWRYIKNMINNVESISANNTFNSIQKLENILSLILNYGWIKHGLGQYISQECNSALYNNILKHIRERLIPIFSKIIYSGVKDGYFKTKYFEDTASLIVSGICMNFSDLIDSIKNAVASYEKVDVIGYLLEKILDMKHGSIHIYDNLAVQSM